VNGGQLISISGAPGYPQGHQRCGLSSMVRRTRSTCRRGTPRSSAPNWPCSSNTAVGLETRGSSGRTRQRRAAHPDQNRAIREWAVSKGYEISARGRIKQEIVDAYHEKAGR